MVSKFGGPEQHFRGKKDWNKLLGEPEAFGKTDAERKLIEELEASAAEIPTEAPEEEPKFDAAQVAQLCELDVNWLAGVAAPLMFMFCFPKVLLAAWQLLTQSATKTRDFSQIALGIPRGHGKTTLIKLFVLWCILFTKKKFILVISANAALAENILADVVDMLNEPNIIAVFGDWKLGQELNRQDLKKFGFRGRNIILAAIGAEGSLRGLNIKNDRPDVMIFEDVQTKECSISKVQSDALEQWIVGTAMKAKSPHGCLFIFCANMYPGPNSILKHLKSVPSWVKFIAGAILSDGTALWEELRPLSELIKELDNDIAMGHAEIFFSEVLNDTEAGINSRVDLAQIKAWPFQPEELPQGKFIVIDPSTGRLGGDDVAIGNFEVYDGTPGLVDIIEENLSPGNTIRRALLMALRSGVKLIAVESTNYQATLLYWFDVIATELGITGISFVEVHTGGLSKNARITNMLKGLTAGELLLHPHVRSRVIHQITNWNPLRKVNVDGVLDCLTYAPKVLELYGYAVATDMDASTLEAQAARVSGVEETSFF
jgi:hypothetical protein